MKKVFSALSSKSFAFFDIYGFIHDGKTLYRGAIDMLIFAKQSCSKVIFLSNAPRSPFSVEKKLLDIGVNKELFDYIVTPYSAFQELFHLGGRFQDHSCFPIGNDIDIIDVAKISGLRIASRIQDADFILMLGLTGDSEYDRNGIYADMKYSINLQKPMVCLNPDKYVISGVQGEKLLCAGTFCDEYQKMGGEVIYFGKPYRHVYDCAHKLTNFADKGKIVAAGDALETDIKGANDFGIDSILVLTGMHSNLVKNNIVDEQEFGRLQLKYNAKPTYLLKTLDE